jgi:hypothetical protein
MPRWLPSQVSSIFATGNIAARLAHSDAILAVATGALVAALVGFADATAGWWISTRLGASPMSPGESWPRRIRWVSVRVAVFAALVGGIGGAAKSAEVYRDSGTMTWLRHGRTRGEASARPVC